MYPGVAPGHLTNVVVSKPWSEWRKYVYVADWLVHQGLQKLVDVFKGISVFSILDISSLVVSLKATTW